MLDLYQTQILPAAVSYQKLLAEAKVSLEGEKSLVDTSLAKLIKEFEGANKAYEELQAILDLLSSKNTMARAEACSEDLWSQMQILRESVDRLETLVQDSLWPLTKYRQMLFSL